METSWTKTGEYRQIRRYRGTVKAVIFDWAGTVVDYGCFSPTGTFINIFKAEGLHVTDADVRGPMGIHKKDHIRKLFDLDTVKTQFIAKFGREPNETDTERLYQKFMPVQAASVKQYAKLIPGVKETVDRLKSMGIKIGSCTGFSSDIVTILKEEAAKQGYFPDAYVAADEVPASRPLPHMVWLNLIRMNIAPIEAVVKVDDTVDGIREGLSAGCWTVGVAKTGNYMACTENQLLALPESELNKKLQRSRDMLIDSGAHYVIDSVADLMDVILDINQNLSNCLKP
jgi:phosphonoacetaldehyde hydrolase